MLPHPRPVLAGCHPDPSVCRVDDFYYLVTSTFAYHPGLPVHRSRDLVSWERIGHVLSAGDRRLDGLDVSDGVWAPTIRHHRGVFYVIWAEARDRRWAQTYVSTAIDAAGPWTIPTALDAEGIDPSLFFDEDGRCWFTAARDAPNPAETGPGELWMREFDYVDLRLVGPEHVLWHGAVRDAWVEAPHIYRQGDRYHLVGAEGGTERNHAVTAAQASSVTGPYLTDPRSPLLSHRHLGESAAVQNVGHVDITDTADGGIAALVLGVRPIDGHHVLGREVFLVPARWSTAGLELASGVGQLANVEMRGSDERPETDWLSLRGPIGWRSSVDGIEIDARETPLASLGRPAFLGRRQSDHRFEFHAQTTAPERVGQRVGVAAFQHQDRWIRLAVTREGDSLMADVVLRIDGDERCLERATIGDGLIEFRIESDGRSYRLSARRKGASAIESEIPHHLLGTEDAGGFVGVLLGLVNEAPAHAPSARFQKVDYVATAPDRVPRSGERSRALRRTTSSVERRT